MVRQLHEPAGVRVACRSLVRLDMRYVRKIREVGSTSTQSLKHYISACVREQWDPG